MEALTAMPKPSVTAGSTQRKTQPSDGDWDERTVSTEIGTQSNCASLSYLTGVVDADDVGGQRDGAIYDYDRYLDKRLFRQQAVEPGGSTFFKSDFERGT